MRESVELQNENSLKIIMKCMHTSYDITQDKRDTQNLRFRVYIRPFLLMKIQCSCIINCDLLRLHVMMNIEATGNMHGKMSLETVH